MPKPPVLRQTVSEAESCIGRGEWTGLLSIAAFRMAERRRDGVQEADRKKPGAVLPGFFMPGIFMNATAEGVSSRPIGRVPLFRGRSAYDLHHIRRSCPAVESILNLLGRHGIDGIRALVRLVKR